MGNQLDSRLFERIACERKASFCFTYSIYSRELLRKMHDNSDEQRNLQGPVS